jgi:Outer membrane protein beta-barrel domain
MKILWLLSATTLFSQFSNAQSEIEATDLASPPLQQYSRFSIGLSYSPEASYRFLGIRKGENEATMQPIIDYRNESETFKYGHTASVHITYDLNKKFSLASGISYTMFGDRTKPFDISSLNGSSYMSIGSASGTNSYHYLSVPVSARFSFGGSALKYIVSPGISASFILASSNVIRIDYLDGGYFESTTSSFGTPISFQRFVLGAHISAGIDYHFSSKFSMQIAPVFRMTATSITDAPISGYYFNTGIETGVRLRL